MPASNATSTSSSATSTEAQQLRELMKVLKKTDMEIDPEVQAVMDKVKVITPKAATKLMHGAVSRLDNTREKLQKALDARQNMHQNWSKFVSDAVERWQKHAESFAKEDAQLQEAISAASNAFHAARDHLEETKDALAEFDDVSDIQILNDEDPMTDTSSDLASGIQELVTTLTRLRDSQDDTIGTASKKPRLEPATVTVVEVKDPPKAMQPFGGGGK